MGTFGPRLAVVALAVSGTLAAGTAIAAPHRAAVPALSAPTGAAAGRASGLPWSDGVFAGHDRAAADAFAAWRGRPLDNVLVFTGRGSWAEQLQPWWRAALPTGFDAGRDDLIIAVPLWPGGSSVSDTGTDAQWRLLAEQIAATDPDALVRLGWEMNCCDFSPATAANAARWRAAWIRAHTLMRTAAPGLTFVFNPNEGPAGKGFLADPRQVYPGDDYVDVVAIDAYDWYPAYDTDANWTLHRDRRYGWEHWYRFARDHGKPFGLGEFGLYSASPASGGDNPRYFREVYRWLADKPAGTIRFVTAYNERDDWYGGRLWPTDRNPAAGAEYRAQLAASARRSGPR